MNKEHLTKVLTALKLESVALVVAKTARGDLTLNLRKDEDKTFFALDSVPVEKELDSDLHKLFGLEE